MKVTIKIPLPTKGEFTTVEADGTPKEVADFLRLWLMSTVKSKESPFTK